MNYITWNGVSSTTVSGLIITSLPPITRPPIRYDEVFVEGRDGSIITPVGLSSYVKSIGIGLKPGTDENAVLAFLGIDGGEHNLILSNESNKYYRARLLEQVDLNRLLRLRQATVNFLVQPYKYKTGTTSVLIPSIEKTYNINNTGNVDSIPLITITDGEGTVTVKKNGTTVFTYTFPSTDSDVYIDSEKEEAYLGSVLKNRNMVGNFLTLSPGNNTISYTGEADVRVYPRSRYI